MRKVIDLKGVTLSGLYVIMANYTDEGWAIAHVSVDDPRKEMEEDDYGALYNLTREFLPEELELRHYDTGDLKWSKRSIPSRTDNIS